MMPNDVASAARFDRYVAAIVSERRPDPSLLTSPLEARMARVTLDLVRSSAAVVDPNPAFVARLRGHLLVLVRDRT